MEPHISCLERAFQLAQSGRCRTLTEIRMRLNEEGYQAEQVTGPELCRQIIGIVEKAATPRARRRPPRRH